MKTFTTKSVKTTDKIYCDVCGNCCTNELNNHENATLDAIWGYGSKQDGKKYDIHLCEICFGCCLKFLRMSRDIALYRPEFDPLNGST